MEAIRKWQTFSSSNRKEPSTYSHIPTKNIFQEWKKNQGFSDEVKVREFVTSRCTLN